MIYGNGVDILEIERIEKVLAGQPRFIARNFSKREQELFAERHFRTETIAANFAAKEAVSKAMGTGIRGFSLNEIEVLRDALGRPYVVLEGRAKDAALYLGIDHILISMSHSDKTVVAFAIAVSKE
ncbi:MAG: holo-[acyl-carrier protein] synthase [Clostridiales bacterium]|jgi:holo-[acyl-carrier-protein] synthase|nr:holo-[acyl-carrier protein] synthase [Clostridiales bacterium]